MTTKTAPVRDRIRNVLESARTSEPYPVWMTWRSLAIRVYGYSRPSKSDIYNIRRVAEKMHDVDLLRFEKRQTHAGARLHPTPEEAWLQSHIVDVYAGTMDGVDYRAYCPPDEEQVLEAFWHGCRQQEDIRVNLCRVVEIVNKRCRTTFDPSDVAWWRVGLEEHRKQLRKDVVTKLHTALVAALVKKEQQEIEARLVTLGPYRVDPEKTPQCPCCRQELPTGLPLARQPTAQQEMTAEPRQPRPQLAGELVG
ncbi:MULTISPECIES: hypothetical protein [unclassified Streptomyces]|uniref:hypothetical protein n=1 Tax=unclassified Streptomyces TaxID=2593676 RepID=UPI002E204DDF|nr:hypothetical protein OG217_37435 [Streptomyces sp. NBC_01023]